MKLSSDNPEMHKQDIRAQNIGTRLGYVNLYLLWLEKNEEPTRVHQPISLNPSGPRLGLMHNAAMHGRLSFLKHCRRVWCNREKRLKQC